MPWGEEAEIVGKRATELQSLEPAEGTADRPRRLERPQPQPAGTVSFPRAALEERQPHLARPPGAQPGS